MASSYLVPMTIIVAGFRPASGEPKVCAVCCNSMRHRTQLYLDESQYAWLRRKAGRTGSIASVVRELVDKAQLENPADEQDPLLSYLLTGPASGPAPSSVTTLDTEIYGP